MNTYTKNGQIHSRFDSQRKDSMESIGRDAARNLFKFYGCTVENNDVHEDGSLDWRQADLRVTYPNGKVVLVEAATKADKIWHCIDRGVDVETRKLKYTDQMGADNLVISMTRGNGREIVLIPGVCLRAAADSCQEQYLGHGSIKDSDEFKMPEHGCHRVRKNCKRENGGWETNDFYRIPYRYVTHIEVTKNGYKIIKKKESLNE